MAGFKLDIETKHDSDADVILATVRFCHLPSGECRFFNVRVPLDPIRRKVLAALRGSVGFSLKGIFKAAKNITKKIGVDKVFKAANAIGKVLKKGMDVASSIYPPLGVSFGAVNAAAKVVNGIQNGVKGAKEKVQQIAALAESGDEAAAKAMATIATLYKAAKETGVDVSGWSVDLPKRSATYYVEPRGRRLFGLLTVRNPPKQSRFARLFGEYDPNQRGVSGYGRHGDGYMEIGRTGYIDPRVAGIKQKLSKAFKTAKRLAKSFPSHPAVQRAAKTVLRAAQPPKKQQRRTVKAPMVPIPVHPAPVVIRQPPPPVEEYESTPIEETEVFDYSAPEPDYSTEEEYEEDEE